MKHPPEKIEFEGRMYRLSGSYYRRHRWSDDGPASLHRAVWQSAHGAIPAGHEIHHKDGDPLNNDLANLECVNITEHRRQHALARRADGTLANPTADCLSKAAK